MNEKNLGLTGMICGIASATLCCGCFGVFVAIAGLVMSIMAKKKGEQQYSPVGIIVSIVGLVLSLISSIGSIIYFCVSMIPIMVK